MQNCRYSGSFFVQLIEIKAYVCYNLIMNARVKAHAKLNLTLAVTGACGGYHTIDSLVCSVDLFDLIVLGKRKDNLVTVSMKGRGTETMPYEDNNAVRAAESYIREFGTRGVDITIYKNIPLGAGMGGSSADAAGVIRGMSKLYGAGSERELKTLADSLGSDTGYMLSGGYAVLGGRGTEIKPVSAGTKLNFLALVPRTPVSTAECYALWDKLSVNLQPSESAVNALERGDLPALGKLLSNALYAPAAKLNPDVKKAHDELSEFSPLGVNMTGSGSAVYALFENAEFCAWAKSRYRGKFECIQLKTVI